jgi:hypothetical protein
VLFELEGGRECDRAGRASNLLAAVLSLRVSRPEVCAGVKTAHELASAGLAGGGGRDVFPIHARHCAEDYAEDYAEDPAEAGPRQVPSRELRLLDLTW